MSFGIQIVIKTQWCDFYKNGVLGNYIAFVRFVVGKIETNPIGLQIDPTDLQKKSRSN